MVCTTSPPHKAYISIHAIGLLWAGWGRTTSSYLGVVHLPYK